MHSVIIITVPVCTVHLYFVFVILCVFVFSIFYLAIRLFSVQ